VKLFSYFRSSAAYRVRIALNLKGLPYDMVPIHLTKDGGRQHTSEFRAINPQSRVPALELSTGEILTQSLAIIEYLNEIHPEPPLLPSDPLARAKSRAIAQMIACDIHPSTISLRFNISSGSLSMNNLTSTPGTITGSLRALPHWRSCWSRDLMPAALR